MTEPVPDYITNEDHGDETDVRLGAGADAPPLPGTWVNRFDAAYWQGQAEQAQAALTAALAQCAALREQLVTAESRCTSLRTALNRTNGLLSDERRAAATQYRRSHLD